MGERIPFDETPKYLGVTLDRTLSYNQHLPNTTVKVSKQCSLLKRLTSKHWGADFTILLTSILVFLLPKTAVQYGVKTITAKMFTRFQMSNSD